MPEKSKFDDAVTNSSTVQPNSHSTHLRSARVACYLGDASLREKDNKHHLLSEITNYLPR